MSWFKLNYNLTLQFGFWRHTLESVCSTKISHCMHKWRAQSTNSMRKCSSRQADKGLEGWATGGTNGEVKGAGLSSGGNTLVPETMRSPFDRVLRTEVLLPLKTRSDLKSLQCSPAVQQCSPWKEASGQNGTGPVTNNMRLEKRYCHQRVPDNLRETKWEKHDKDEHFFLLSWSWKNPRVPVQERQTEAESSPVCHSSEQSSGKVISQSMAEPAAWQVSNKVFVDKIWVELGSLNICQREGGQDHHGYPFFPLL